jgi:hypothetical protein
MSDTPDPAHDRERFAERLRKAGLDYRRFIDVRDGEKATRTRGHQKPENWLTPDDSRLSGNYGVHPGAVSDGDPRLVEFDVDDYDDVEDTDALDQLEETFAVESPHTPAGESGHHYYRVGGEDIDVLEELTGTLNPEPAWGEIKAEGKYVVGPGSQLDGCSKEWCDECAKSDGGYYRIANDVPIATLTRDDLESVIRSDSELGSAKLPNGDGNKAVEGGSGNETPTPEAGESPSGDGETGESGERDAPDAMPPCYREALKTRVDPRDATVNEHEVSKHAALLGLWAGYDTEVVVEHMTEEFAPGEHAGIKTDDDETEYQVEKLSEKTERDSPLRPPSPVKLKQVGVLPEIAPDTCGERCVVHSTTSTDGGTVSESGDGVGRDSSESGDDGPEPDYPLVDNYNGGYSLHHPSKDDDDDGWYKQLTNFEMEVSTFLRKPDGDSVEADLTVYPGGTGETYDVTVPMTVFNETRPFKREVVTGRTTRFDGDTGDLNELREFVGGQPAPERIGVKRIGLFGDEFSELVTPAGTLGASGWVEEPNHAYVRQGIGVEAKWSLDSESATFDHEAVAEALETLPQTREADRLLPVLGWFYASGFRPLIHEWTGEFNILNVTGGTGAGKSSTLGTLWRLFGMDDDPLSVAEETKFAVTRSMAATNSVPVWFDEYKPATTDSWRIDALHGLLRTVTRGGTVQRGNADKTTDEYTLSAPVAVSGEQRIQGSAEQRRCIMTTFSPSATDDGTDTARAYKELTGEGYLEDGEFVGTDAVDPQAHALAYYQFIARYDAGDARERWNTAAEDVADMIDTLDEADALGSAARQGLQTVVFGLRLYREFAESVGADVEEIVDEDAIESAVQYSGREFVGGGHKSHVDTLIELVAAAARAEYIEEDEHYSVVNSGSPAAEIRVNMTAAFDQITRYVRDHDVSADLLDTYGDYRDRFKEAHEENGGYVVSYRQYTRGIGRAIGIHARRATDALDGFEARAMNCEIIADRPESDSEESESANDEKVSGEIPQAERLSLVGDAIDALCERDDGAEHARVGDIVNMAMDAGMDESDANSALDKLSKQGDIFQPLSGQYRTQ